MTRWIALLLAALLGVVVVGIGNAQEPSTAIARTPITLPGAQEPHTPPEYNRAVAFRYYREGAETPGIVLVLIPGVNSGPNTLDILARELLGQDANLEVWVTAPRATLLQDRRGIAAALDYRSPDFALGYYYGTLSIDGATYHPLAPDAVGYAAYWGLDVHLRDVRAVVQEVHRRYPGARVVLGGHSLGGILSALYAGYDFDRVPGPRQAPLANGVPAPSLGAGARDLDGLLLLDGVPLALVPRLTGGQYMNGIHLPVLPQVPGVNELLGTSGRRRVGPFTDIAEIARPNDSILLDVIATYAYFRPDAASYLPFSPWHGLPITNEAVLGTIFSDQVERNLFVRASVGSPLGIFPRVPDPANVSRAGLLDLATGHPAPGHALIAWIPYDRTQPPGHVDLRALERAILMPGADFTQWYVPWRLALDMGLAVSLDTSDEFARRYASLTQVKYTRLPLLILGAGNGLIRSPQQMSFYRAHIATPPDQVTVEIFPGYSHLDLVDAVDNPAVTRIVGWLGTMLH